MRAASIAGSDAARAPTSSATGAMREDRDERNGRMRLDTEHVAQHAPGRPTGDDAEWEPEEERGNDEHGREPDRSGGHLPTHEAEGLEHGEVAPPKTHDAHHRVHEQRHGEHREETGQEQRERAHPFHVVEGVRQHRLEEEPSRAVAHLGNHRWGRIPLEVDQHGRRRHVRRELLECRECDDPAFPEP